MDNKKVSPKITDNENMIPKTDAIAAFKKETKVESLSFFIENGGEYCTDQKKEDKSVK